MVNKRDPRQTLVTVNARRVLGRYAAQLGKFMLDIEADRPVDWDDFARLLRETETAALSLKLVEEQARSGAAA